MVYDNTVGTRARGERKFDIQWLGPYLVEGYGRNHKILYYLKHIHRKQLPETHHGNRLRLFHPRPGLLVKPWEQEPYNKPKHIRKLRIRAEKVKSYTTYHTSMAAGTQSSTVVERNGSCSTA